MTIKLESMVVREPAPPAEQGIGGVSRQDGPLAVCWSSHSPQQSVNCTVCISKRRESGRQRS